jgi:hypothetical protein
VECRFAPWHRAFVKNEKLAGLLKPESAIEAGSVRLLSLSGNTEQSVDIPANELYRALRNPLFANIEIGFREKPAQPVEKMVLEDVPLKVWYRSDTDRKFVTVAMLRQLVEDESVTGLVRRYINQLKKASEVMALVKHAVHQHRNLAEDYCQITTIGIVDVAICVDIEMKPTADIEAVLGKAYWLIEQYFNPTIPFYTLQQLLDKQVAIEDIFNGPPLKHGFILTNDLDAAQLKTSLHSSDIINILMDIEGIVAVKNLSLARYNAAGKLVESQPWTLAIPEGHQPRLYVHGSKVLVYKNDLPFLPSPDELNDTLQLMYGQNRQNKWIHPENDLVVPDGKFINNATHWPLQNMLPDTYGVGETGLPQSSTIARRANAIQLKAYLMVFEHLLQVYLLQLKNFRDLFSTNPSIAQTWFAHLLTDAEHPGAGDIYLPGVSEPELHEILETHPQFVSRRNKFLDHLLARFAENFSDYALHVFAAYGNEVKAGEVLIGDKIKLLQHLPQVSANRAKAFDYKNAALTGAPENIAGLLQRLKLLLGFNGFESLIALEVNWNTTEQWLGSWKLNDMQGNTLLQSSLIKNMATEAALRTELVNQSTIAVQQLSKKESLQVVPAGTKFKVQLLHVSAVVAVSVSFDTIEAATAHLNNILACLSEVEAAQKMMLVEHILLRPRHKPSPLLPQGDGLLPICITPDCNLCGEEDPYSFRITLVLNGEQEMGLANQGLAFRRYAEKAIRMEVPAHMGVKICWVSKRQLLTFEKVYADWLAALANDETDSLVLSNKLHRLLCIFEKLKSVYPPASLHDCVDGDDENRVYLNNTVI